MEQENLWINGEFYNGQNIRIVGWDTEVTLHKGCPFQPLMWHLNWGKNSDWLEPPPPPHSPHPFSPHPLKNLNVESEREPSNPSLFVGVFPHRHFIIFLSIHVFIISRLYFLSPNRVLHLFNYQWGNWESNTFLVLLRSQRTNKPKALSLFVHVLICVSRSDIQFSSKHPNLYQNISLWTVWHPTRLSVPDAYPATFQRGHVYQWKIELSGQIEFNFRVNESSWAAIIWILLSNSRSLLSVRISFLHRDNERCCVLFLNHISP